LSDNIQIDAVVISVNSLASNELRYNRVVRVNFIFNGSVEGLLPQGVWNDDEEKLDYWLLGLVFDWSSSLFAAFLNIDIVPKVGVDGVLEVLD